MRRRAWSLLALLTLAACTSSGPPRGTSTPATSSLGLPSRVVPERFPFSLPRHGSVLVLGDSWTYGYYAQPITNGYAYVTARLLGLTADVEGVGGTGYVNVGPGPAHGGGTYAQRLARLPRTAPALVLVSGSLNDLHHPAATVLSAEEDTLAAVKTRYPRSQVVVVGLGSSKPGYENYVVPGSLTMHELDVLTSRAAAAEHLNYISPISEAWFLPGQTQLLMTAGLNPHPTNYGHAVFANRLVADLRALSR